ncbi:hypothetical protein B0H14DRAFT_2587051 [Mycena olivaceomarginata]|nr:hypothetical protein B0H14DRAFT_2587051 [Mycena olivaceomarginata]
MAEPAPYKRTRCLTEDSEQVPCERCVRKGLVCEYVPVADEEEQSMRDPAPNKPSSKYASASQPIPPAGQVPGPYHVGRNRSSQGGNPAYPASNQWGPTPFNPSARSPGSGANAYYSGGNPYSNQPQAYNHGPAPTLPYTAAAPPQHGSSSGYPPNSVYPSNWPAFPSSSSQPQ